MEEQVARAVVAYVKGRLTAAAKTEASAAGMEFQAAHTAAWQVFLV